MYFYYGIYCNSRCSPCCRITYLLNFVPESNLRLKQRISNNNGKPKSSTAYTKQTQIQVLMYEKKKTNANGFSSHTPLGIKNTLKYFLLLFNLYYKRIKIMSASLIKRGRHFLCNCHIDVTRYAFFYSASIHCLLLSLRSFWHCSQNQ